MKSPLEDPQKEVSTMLLSEPSVVIDVREAGKHRLPHRSNFTNRSPSRPDHRDSDNGKEITHRRLSIGFGDSSSSRDNPGERPDTSMAS
jgi:hypothetical protein